MTKKIIASTLLSAGILATPGIAFASLPSDENLSQGTEKHVAFDKSAPIHFWANDEGNNSTEKEDNNSTDKCISTSSETAEEDQSDSEKEENGAVDGLPAEETSESNEDAPKLCPFPCLLV